MDERPSDVVVPGTGGVEASVPRASAPVGSPDESSGYGYGVKERGKEQVRRYSSMAREQAFRRADKRKSTLASAIENFAFTIGETGENLERRGLGSQKEVTDQVADRLRRFSRSLRENSSEDLAAQAGQQFRQRPGLILAGIFAIGFLGSRLLKA